MSAYNFDSLKAHKGHRMECVTYGRSDDPLNVAVECLDCNEVILDYDREEPVDEFHPIEIEEDYVTISDPKGEIVHWSRSEWEEDPTVAITIAKAIDLCHTEGTMAVRTLLNR